MPRANPIQTSKASAYRDAHPEYREKERLAEKLRRREQRKDPAIRAQHNEASRVLMAKKRVDPAFKEASVARTREWRNKLRTEMFEAYGGQVCACCGETERVFLQLDHIDGGGRHHRRALGDRHSSFSTVLDLSNRGWPSGFQILCANCNMAKHLLGVCPHQSVKNAQS